jgi:hypothetical protein
LKKKTEVQSRNGTPMKRAFSTLRRGGRRDAEKIASNNLFPVIGSSLCLCVWLKDFLLPAEKIQSQKPF